MLFALPDHDTLYAALAARDTALAGQAWVCVRTTGIFCRFGCPARTPKSENCVFEDSIAACLNAGFRPCKRCHPMGAPKDPAIADLLSALDADPSHRWSEEDIIARGLDPSTIRRAFKRQFGVTFLDMARLARLRAGFDTLADGARVIDAQHAAGFDSPAAFRDAFARLLGAPPAEFTGDALLRADWIDTPLGAMIAVCDDTHLHLLEFADRKALPTELKSLRKGARIGIGATKITDQTRKQLGDYFNGTRRDFDLPLMMHGSPFTKSVWHQLLTIPYGQTRSYADQARAIGNPAATRAVARANGANQIAIVIPCHRVLGSDGGLTGFGGGLWRKQRLLNLERS